MRLLAGIPSATFVNVCGESVAVDVNVDTTLKLPSAAVADFWLAACTTLSVWIDPTPAVTDPMPRMESDVVPPDCNKIEAFALAAPAGADTPGAGAIVVEPEVHPVTITANATSPSARTSEKPGTIKVSTRLR